MAKSVSNGKIVIISSPSGGGKTTICHKLRQKNKDWQFSISCTTRAQRKGEKDGREYHFMDKAKFMKLRREKYFAETAGVHLSHYGTPKIPLEKALKTGQVMLLDVDVKGAFKLKKKYPQSLSIFIMPPSKAELKKRLKKRGTETEKQLTTRLGNSLREMGMSNRFDYIIVNKDVNEAVSSADHIIKSWSVGVTFFGRNKSKAYSVKNLANR